MSKVQIDAPRIPHDLSSFAFSAGTIGGLKTIGWHPVLPGDGFECDLVGAMRLAPLRRGLAVDCKTEIFSFYVPYRMVYGFDLWNQFIRAADGTGDIAVPVLPSMPGPAGDAYEDLTAFLATIPASNGHVPLWLYKSYEMIWNNYFKHPQGGNHDYSDLAQIPEIYRYNGFQTAHLPCIWSQTSTLEESGEAHDDTMDVTGGLSIQGLNESYGRMHMEQERAYFAQRYRDLMQGFGGYANPDAESRPTLLMHSEFWSSGYDVNGTDQTSLGGFSGRVQQSFKHTVPRFYVPEHGVIMHLMLNRFPPTSSDERHFLISNPNPTYSVLAGDPAVVGNVRPQVLPLDSFMRNGDGFITIPHSQWYRTHPSYVDFHYHALEGFPFLKADLTGAGPTGTEQQNINADYYDQVFQTTQLGHWNAQMKFNTTVLRRLPTARESLLTSV